MNKQIRLLIIGCIVFLGTISLGGSNLPDLSSSDKTKTPKLSSGDSLTDDQISTINSIIDEIMLKSGAPGLVLGIWKGEMPLYTIAKGYADVSSKRELRTEDYFRIASMTKTFTATVILQLADEKLINLDDKLSKYITTLPNADKITIREMLNMSSGIPEILANPTVLHWLTTAPQLPRSPYDLYYFMTAAKPEFEPGSQCKYSNSNYLILGMIIEQITHQTSRDAIMKRVINKLGLKHTYYPETAEMPPPYSKGYAKDKDGKIVEVPPCWPTGGTAGAMISNMNDMGIYVRKLYYGSLISPEANKERQVWRNISGMAQNAVNNRIVKFGYGLGLFNIGGGIGNGGMMPGYCIGAYYYPSKDITLVIEMNLFDMEAYENGINKICQVLFGNEYPFAVPMTE